MASIEVVAVSLAAVFGGLGMLTFIISLFPLIFRAKPAAAPAAVQPEALPQEDADELNAVLMAAVQAYEDEARINPLVRNAC